MTTNNHQAHGPVSLDRLHQIREILSKAAAQSDGGNLGYAMVDAVKVINGAIAAFGAEPVGTFRKGPCGYYPSFHEDAVPLYTTPPAPVVPEEVMPGGLVYSTALPEFESKDSDKVVGYYCFISGKTQVVESQEQAYADAKSVINACRNAMLNGDTFRENSISSTNNFREISETSTNSPVIPDGSEDTKRLDWLDAQNKRLNEYYGTSYGWKFDANFQRNAMMLNDSNYPVMTVRQAIDKAIAAAPQQETNN